MFKFVVWGAGIRGKTAAEIFGADRIVAFIDSNPEKSGTVFCNKPIIDFACYKKNYAEYAVLVSLAAEKAVTDILKKENKFFFIYNECPPELMGYGWNRARNYINKIKISGKKFAIYGHTLYSVLAYEYLENAGYECVGLIHNSPLSPEESQSFEEMFPSIIVKQISDIKDDTTVLQTVFNYDFEHDLLGHNVQNIYDWKDYIPDYYNPQIARLNNRYNGTRCFIIATGPSLTFDDLEKLNKNHVFCISMNSIFCCFGETAWRPEQYVAVDVDVIKNYDKYIREMNVREKFIPDACIDFDYSSLTDEFYVYHSIYTKDTLEQGLISDDFAKYAYNSGTVTAVCLQLAMYEGFSEIYLLGCDCSYFQTGLKHFNEPEKMQIKEYGVMDSTIEMLDYHIKSYEKIREYAEHKGIKIYNATRGGFLEAFERVNFDELF